LVTGGEPPAAAYPQAVQARVQRALRRLNVTLIPETCVGVEVGALLLANGARLVCDAPVLAVGTQAPAWLADSGLALDEAGYLAVNAFQQSTSHPRVFAAGDVASRVDVPHARNGVHAVRAGVPLLANLRAAMHRTPPDLAVPRRRLRLQDRPGVLSRDPQGHGAMPMPPELLVGIETADDAAVYQLNDEQALIATTDFFMPIVDDPFDFGRIAATNAISDVYAMGGRPILALALVGMPINVLSTATIGRILEGGASVCRAAGIPIAGGHTIDSVEAIYGLVALGLVHPERVKRNADARVRRPAGAGQAAGRGRDVGGAEEGRLGAAGYAR
jgi:hypothetical protein